MQLIALSEVCKEAEMHLARCIDFSEKLNTIIEQMKDKTRSTKIEDAK